MTGAAGCTDAKEEDDDNEIEGERGDEEDEKDDALSAFAAVDDVELGITEDEAELERADHMEEDAAAALLIEEDAEETLPLMLQLQSEPN